MKSDVRREVWLARDLGTKQQYSLWKTQPFADAEGDTWQLEKGGFGFAFESDEDAMQIFELLGWKEAAEELQPGDSVPVAVDAEFSKYLYSFCPDDKKEKEVSNTDSA